MRSRHRVVRVGVLVLGAVALAAMAVGAHSFAYFPGDLEISRAVQAAVPSWLEPLLTAISWSGFPPQTDVLFGIVVVLVLVVFSRWAALMEGLAAVGSGALYFLLEALVGQPRPTADLVRVAFPVKMSGFPSGHLSTFTAVFGFLAFLTYRRLRPSPARWVPVVLVAAFLGLLSVARIYSGQHWPSDVLAGLLLGSLWLGVTVAVYLWGEARQQRRAVTADSAPPRTLEHEREASPVRARSG